LNSRNTLTLAYLADKRAQMTLGTRLLLIIQFLLLGSGSLYAQQVQDYLVADSLHVGDKFNFTITLNKDKLYDAIQFPDSADFPTSIDIRQRKHFKLTQYRDSVVYELQFFGTEDQRLESLPITLIAGTDTTTLYTTPAMLRFASVLQDEQGEFKPLKPIYQFARAWWPWILGGAIVFGLLFWGYLRSKKFEPQLREEPEPIAPPPAFEHPLSQLEENIASLKESDLLLQQRDFDAFYVKLGDTIREYLERVYEFPALESTTTEIIQEMRSNAADNQMLAATRTVLQEADMVKFAKFEPTLDQAYKAIEKAEQFIERARELDRGRIEAMKRAHKQKYAEQAEAYAKQDQNA
jgi:hypothetical protein